MSAFFSMSWSACSCRAASARTYACACGTALASTTHAVAAPSTTGLPSIWSRHDAS